MQTVAAAPVAATPVPPVRLAPPRREALARAGEYLTFFLAGECHAMAILGVQEIRGYVEPTRIASAPGYMKGIINLRGTIVPIVDLRVLAGCAAPACDERTATIIVDVGSRCVGVVVDAVADVLHVEAGRIKPAPECTAALAGSHVTGIATLGAGDSARLLILIDPARMLADADVTAPAEFLA